MNKPLPLTKGIFQTKLKISTLLLFFILMFLSSAVVAQQPASMPAFANSGKTLTKVDPNSAIGADVESMLHKFDKQINFTQNKGQWDKRMLYKADFTYGQAVATDKGMLVSSYDPESLKKKWAQGFRAEEAEHDGKPFNEAPVKVKGHAWLMDFVGSSPKMHVANKTEHGDVNNYFYGERQATNVKSYNEVWYSNVYDNIDVRYYPSAEGALEYDVIVKPGANPAQIAINHDGIDKMYLKDGNVVLKTSVGDMELPAPYAYQMVNGKEVAVEVDYILNGNALSFALGKYNTSLPLVIDPIALRWATWTTTGSTGDCHGHGIWVDGSGNIYTVSRVDGSTGAAFITGAFDASANGSVDLLVGKYTEPATVGGSGTRVWQTYIGHSGSDNPYATEMGPDGNLYMVGVTSSTSFPLSGGSAFSGASGLDYRAQGGSNGFVLKIAPDGQSIKAAVIGGNSTEELYDLRFTAAGDVICGGLTQSSNLSTLGFSGASNTANGSNDAFVFKINANLSAVTWMKNFGGSGSDICQILLNHPTTGDIYIAGLTASTSGIALNATHEATLGGAQAGFIQKLNSAGTTQWGTYVNSTSGGSTSILCMEFNVAKDRLYFGGLTTTLSTASDPVGTVYDNSHNGNNDFYVGIMTTGQVFVNSTYVGSSASEYNMMGLNTDANNDVYVFGYSSGTFTTAGNPLQNANQGGNDKIFFKLKSDLTSMLYLSYYGGAGAEDDPIGERGIKFSNCKIYTIVTSASNNIPLTNGALTTTAGSLDNGHEPGLVVWANPPDMINNEIGSNQTICSGGTPLTLDGQTPSYVLPTIIRNGTTSAHPSVGSAGTFQWQKSTDGGTTWVNISGATGEDLTSAQIGPLTQTTTFRRIINGDYCTLSAQTNVLVKVFTISGVVVNNTCFGVSAGTITITPTDGTSGYQYSINGGANYQNSNVFSGLAAGIYTITAKDALNCIATAQFTITQPTQITFTATPSNATCGASNGSIVVSGVSGGSGSGYTYSINGTTYQSGTTLSGLAAGTYTVYVKDGSGCVRTISVTVGSANPLVASSSNQVNVLCFGQATGSVQIGSTGGTAPFQYQQGNGAFGNNNTFSSLAAGTYTFTVRDANQCTASVTVIITGPAAPLSASIQSKVDVLCFGNATGSVTISAQGGTVGNGYQYQLGNGQFQLSNTFSGLTAGNYVVTVKDANGCTTTVNVTINGPAAPLTASIQSQVDVLCFGNATGSVTISAQGGTVGNGYQYQLGNGQFQLSNTFSGLTAGNYVVTVKDANGCIKTVNVTINGPAAPLTASIQSQVDVLCFGNATGSVTISAQGGTVGNGYQYQLGNGQFQLSNTFSGLTAGNYVVTVKDANGCIKTVNVTINGPAAPLTASIQSQVDVLCFGNATGSVTISAQGGTVGNGYQYQLGNGQFQLSNTFSGLTAGNYVVTVKDANGCIKTVNVTINGPAAPLSAGINSQTNVSCFGGNDGSVTIGAQGGTVGNGYQYQLGNGQFQLSPTFGGLAMGSYVVTVKDANGCTTTVNVTITQPNAPLAANISNSVNVCPGYATGSATVSVSGGTPNYSYSWNTSPVQTGATANGLAAGTYTVTVTDSKQCTTTATVTISNNPLPNAGGDQSICTKTVSLGSAGAANSWSAAAGNPSNATVDNAGNVAGMTVGGVYLFVLTNQFGCTDTVAITTTSNCPLIANPDNATTNEDTPVTINVPSNDVDPDGNINNSSVVVVTPPTNGTVVVNPNGSITYTPNPNYNGPDSFIYNICDTGMPVYCDTALVTINVVPVNDPPIANIDHSSTNEDTPVTINVPSNDTDVDGNLDNSSVTITDQPNNGTVVVNPNGSIVYTPNANFNGVDTLIYQICDTGMPVLCDTALVIINVIPVNDPPIANIDHSSTNEDTPVTINVPSNDTDVDGNLDNTSVTITDQPNNGTVVVNPNGSIVYTPNANFNGVDTLIYQICDTGMPVLCDTALVIINVIPVNDPPIANIDHSSTNEDTPVTINVPSNDTDVDGNLDNSSVTIVDQPNNGTVVVNPNGSIVYTPNNNFNGVDTLIYQICDTGMPVLCDTALVIINVNTVNDPPIANIDHSSTNEDTPVNIFVPGNDTDLDGNLDNSSVTITDQPNNGTVVVNPNGSIDYTPNPNFNGVDTLIYQICDTGMPVLCDTALVIINVIPVNDPPIANIDHSSTNEDTPVTINVPSNDTDVDGNLDNSSVTIVDQPNNGTVVVNPNGSIVYTPNNNFNGVDTLIYQICDTGMPVLCDTALVIINVNPVNDPPVANVDTATTPEDTPVTIDVPSNDTDPDGNLDSTSVTIIDPPTNGTVVVDSTGNIIYTPNTNYNGPDTLIYQICDTGMPVMCDTALVIINVTPVNDPPVAVTDTASTLEDTPIGINIDINDYDVDGNLDTNSVVIVIPPVNGTAVYDTTIGQIIYIPNPDYFGPDSLLYQICDTDNMCDTAWVYINVISTPDISLDPSIYPSGNNISCFGANDGSINLTIDLGTPPYIISWTGPNGFTSSDEDIDSLAPGTYTVVVTDLNGHAVTASITLTEPTLLQGSGIVFSYNGGYNVSCGGQTPACDGSIDYTVSGGSPAYTISWTGPNGFTASTADISGLCAGTYTILVTDLNGCTVTNTYTLTAPPAVDPVAVAANFNGYNVSCNGSCNGSIDLTVNGGVAPFSYAWSGPSQFSSISEDISGLCAGTYSVTVTDANGCTATISITLTQPPVLSGSAVAATYNGGVNVSCVGACDGSINASVTGGVAPYSYSWVGPNGFVSSQEDISSLCVGQYTLTITDANGCSTTVPVTITPPTPVSANLAAAIFGGGFNVSCSNACDGSINATISGGVAPYQYSWLGPNGFVAISEDISSLCPGAYTLTVTDANGCTTTQSITLTAPPSLEAGGAALEYNGGWNVSCANSCDGAIDGVASGGVAPYSFIWSGPNGFTSQSQNISNLCAGTYVLTVTDANGCVSSETITLTQPPVLGVSIVAATYNGGVNTSCANSCDGAINSTVSGGTAPYSYSWIGPSGFVAVVNDISALCAGTYNLTVTDANGCSATASVTLVAPDTLSGAALAATTNGGTNISCSGVCDGSINLTVSGGTAPYAINWVGPNGFVSSQEDLANLCAGTYVATITDANGCSATVSITLTEPTPINASGVVLTYTGGNNVSCNGASNGAINLTVSGGSPAYSYAWTGPNGFISTDQNISGLAAGHYQVVVTDVNGCSATLEFDLTQPNIFDVDAQVTPSSCGNTNGSIVLTVSGGTPQYNYSWVGPNGPIGGNSASLTGIMGGFEYFVTITDANGCSFVDTIYVNAKPPVLADATVVGTTCNGVCNGYIDLNIYSGEPTYIINWTGPNGFSSSNEDLFNACAGTYVVDIVDANGCTGSFTFEVTQPEAIAINVTSNNPATCLASNGSVNLTVTGGTPAYTYAWVGPNSFSSSNEDISGLVAGAYIVTVTDSNGCDATLPVNVGSNNNLDASIAVTNVSCNGMNNGIAEVTLTNAAEPVTYFWNVDDQSAIADTLAPGTYIVLITDANGCTATDTAVVTEPDMLALAGDVLIYPNGYNVSANGATDGVIDLTVTGGSGAYTFNWQVVSDSLLEDQFNLAPDTYTVVVTDANGCVLEQEFILEGPPIIELPTGFSPGNFDGMNDYYVIHGALEFPDNEFTVFNRWGQVVFEKESYKNDWAGTNYSGNLMPDGTYFILFKVNIPGKGEVVFKETVELRHTNKN